MDDEEIIDKIKCDGGITLRIEPDGHAQLARGDYWYFPVLPDTTVICSISRLEPALATFRTDYHDELAADNRYLGIWFNPDENRYYIDVNERHADKSAALDHARAINKSSKRQIIAIYNPEQDEEASV